MISIGTFNEQSTGVFDCVFTDENGDAVTPDSVKWTITDNNDNIINEREQVDVVSLGTTITITIFGDDLKLSDYEVGEYADRYIVIEGTYTSDLGAGLPTTEHAFFQVKNLKYIG